MAITLANMDDETRVIIGRMRARDGRMVWRREDGREFADHREAILWLFDGKGGVAFCAEKGDYHAYLPDGHRLGGAVSSCRSENQARRMLAIAGRRGGKAEAMRREIEARAAARVPVQKAKAPDPAATNPLRGLYS